jgi:two-component system, response regulator PdtaR
MDTSNNKAKPVVLIAEDEPLLRLQASDLLEDHGFEVVEAEDAAGALRAMENRPDVHLLFTDIQMPGRLDGMDLARQVHARWPHVLLVITSGQKRPRPSEIPDDGRFVAKPYGAEELFFQIDDLMNKA